MNFKNSNSNGNIELLKVIKSYMIVEIFIAVQLPFPTGFPVS
jgi:hypothetical protein